MDTSGWRAVRCEPSTHASTSDCSLFLNANSASRCQSIQKKPRQQVRPWPVGCPAPRSESEPGAPWRIHYYMGLRKKITPHRTLGQRANAPVDLNTPVSSFREQVCMQMHPCMRRAQA